MWEWCCWSGVFRTSWTCGGCISLVWHHNPHPHPYFSRTRGKKAEAFALHSISLVCATLYRPAIGNYLQHFVFTKTHRNAEKMFLGAIFFVRCSVQCSPDTLWPLEGNRGNMCPPIHIQHPHISFKSSGMVPDLLLFWALTVHLWYEIDPLCAVPNE